MKEGDRTWSDLKHICLLFLNVKLSKMERIPVPYTVKMKTLIKKWKEFCEVIPQPQHIIFNNLSTFTFHVSATESVVKLHV